MNQHFFSVENCGWLEFEDRVAFESLQEWALSCASATGNCGEPLPQKALDLAAHKSIICVEQRNCLGEQLYGFRFLGMRTEHLRFFTTAHAAIVLAIDLVPGLTLRVEDDTKSTDRRNDRLREPEEQIYVVNVEIAQRANAGKRIGPARLPRVLFGAPADAALRELYGSNHLLMIPQSYVLTKRRLRRGQTPPIDRARFLNLVDQLLKTARGMDQVRFLGADFISLFEELFRIADRQHGHELIGGHASSRERDGRSA